MNYLLGILLYIGIPFAALSGFVILAMWIGDWHIGTFIVIVGLAFAGGLFLAAYEEGWYEKFLQ